MTTITIPAEIEKPLAEEARKRGTTPEILALECLRKHFVAAAVTGQRTDGETLFDFLSGHIGTVDGTTEALSERCGERFAEGMVEKHQRGRL